MFKKLYEKSKKFIIEYHNSILFIILVTLVLNIKTPYVVNSPGGLISLSDRVTINGKNIDSNYYTTYVSVMNGKVACVLASFFIPNWDLEKYEEYSGNSDLSYDELTKVEKLAMKEGNNIAKAVALEKSGIGYTKKNSKIYVYYKSSEYENDFEIGDEIIKCEGNKIDTTDEFISCVNSVKGKVHIDVVRDNKEVSILANTYDYEDRKIVGVNILNEFDIDSDYDIQIKANKSESGSSGGFMTALSLYDSLANLNLSKNLKIAGTGTIDIKGNVGKIAGVKYKLLGAEKKKADVFFCPEENYDEALKVKRKYNLKIKLIKVRTIDDAINYLNSLKK